MYKTFTTKSAYRQNNVSGSVITSVRQYKIHKQLTNVYYSKYKN